MRFGYVARSCGEIVAREGDFADPDFCWLVGPDDEMKWMTTNRAGIRNRYIWVDEYERLDPNLVPRLVSQGNCLALFFKPREGFLAAICGISTGMDIVAIYKLGKEVEKTFLVTLAKTDKEQR